MSGKFFWLLIACVFVVVGHLSYVLFAPEYWMGKKLQTVLSDNGASGFVELKGTKRQLSLPAEDPGLVIMVCSFDVSSKPTKILVPSLNQFWSLSIYSNKGDSYYTINDRQTLNSSLAITLDKARTQVEGDEKPKLPNLEKDKVSIAVNSIKGWAILRMQNPDQASRRTVGERAGGFTCTAG